MHRPVEVAAQETRQSRRIRAALAGDVARISSEAVRRRCDGSGGSTSRMVRRISSKPALSKVSGSNGGRPVSNS